MVMGDLLNAVRELSPTELDQFVSEVLQVRAQRVAPSLSRTEAELLRRINHGLPKETRERFRHLVARRRDGSLTAEEQAELLRLVDEVENTDAQRVEALAELAQLRHKPVRVLMEELALRALGEHPPAEV
jgi:hypothetical protein